MHELSVCLALVQQLQAIAREQGAESIDRVILNIGPLSGIEPELLRNAYPLAAAGTAANAAELVIHSADIIVRCNTCGAKSIAAANRLLCGACGDFRTRLMSGDEMQLQRVEFRRSQKSNEAVIPSVT